MRKIMNAKIDMSEHKVFDKNEGNGFDIQQKFNLSSPFKIMMFVLILLRNDQKIKSCNYTCNQLNQIYTFIKHK